MFQQFSEYAWLASIAGTALATGALLLFRRKRHVAPEEMERIRRLTVNQSRRTTEAFLTDRADEVLHYKYDVRGVTYYATQDASALRHLLPEDLQELIGPVSVKYDPDNPANSIVICEEWSGIRRK